MSDGPLCIGGTAPTEGDCGPKRWGPQPGDGEWAIAWPAWPGGVSCQAVGSVPSRVCPGWGVSFGTLRLG